MPPALLTAATTSRQWLKAKIGNSMPSRSQIAVLIASSSWQMRTTDRSPDATPDGEAVVFPVSADQGSDRSQRATSSISPVSTS